MIPYFRGCTLPAIIPSICSNAAANMSLASLIILLFVKGKFQPGSEKIMMLSLHPLNDSCFLAGLIIQLQMITPTWQANRENFWSSRPELIETFNELRPTVDYYNARPLLYLYQLMKQDSVLALKVFQVQNAFHAALYRALGLHEGYQAWMWSLARGPEECWVDQSFLPPCSSPNQSLLS